MTSIYLLPSSSAPCDLLVKQQEEISQIEVCVSVDVWCECNTSHLKASQVINLLIQTKDKKIGLVTKQIINREHLLRIFLGGRVHPQNASGSLENCGANERSGYLRGGLGRPRWVGGGSPCCLPLGRWGWRQFRAMRARKPGAAWVCQLTQRKNLFSKVNLVIVHVVKLSPEYSAFWILPLLFVNF